MYTFPELIRKIRNEAGLTQAEFAKAVDVSPVLIAMVETGQKEVSKKLLLKIAERLDVHPASITPFLYGSADRKDGSKLSAVELHFLSLGARLQQYLIKNRAKTLRKYAE
jgi:transcriptional regulator with XRE-family HTH domain